MVDFRYHLVSIIAVFLALTIGLVLGTTTLNGGVVHDLNSRVSGLIATKQTQQASIEALSGELGADDAVVATLMPRLVAGTLAGESVVVFSLPGSPGSTRDAVAATLRAAGATVGLTVDLNASFVDPASAPALAALADRWAPAGLTLTGQPGPSRAAAVLAALATAPGDPARLGGALDAFRSAKFISPVGAGPASLAVVLVGAPSGTPPTGDASAAVADGLAGTARLSASGAVIAGPLSADSGAGLLVTLSGDPVSRRVSLLDGVDRHLGQLELVEALREQLSGGAGHYGVGSGATPLPTRDSPAPTPQTTPVAGPGGGPTPPVAPTPTP